MVAYLELATLRLHVATLGRGTCMVSQSVGEQLPRFF
jgi:hypothetical protein